MNKKNSENDAAQIKSFEITTKIAKLADQAFMSSAQLQEIVSDLCLTGNDILDMAGKDRGPAIFTITQLMELIRQLPMKFFREIDNRAHILEAMQAQLNELIIIEEQEEKEEIGNDIIDDEYEEEECSVENVVKNA